jgi:hypothetical protein
MQICSLTIREDNPIGRENLGKFSSEKFIEIPVKNLVRGSRFQDRIIVEGITKISVHPYKKEP